MHSKLKSSAGTTIPHHANNYESTTSERSAPLISQSFLRVSRAPRIITFEISSNHLAM